MFIETHTPLMSTWDWRLFTWLSLLWRNYSRGKNRSKSFILVTDKGFYGTYIEFCILSFAGPIFILWITNGQKVTTGSIMTCIYYDKRGWRQIHNCYYEGRSQKRIHIRCCVNLQWCAFWCRLWSTRRFVTRLITAATGWNQNIIILHLQNNINTIKWLDIQWIIKVYTPMVKKNQTK